MLFMSIPATRIQKKQNGGITVSIIVNCSFNKKKTDGKLEILKKLLSLAYLHFCYPGGTKYHKFTANQLNLKEIIFMFILY